jgi:hypothetical protein
MSLCRHDIDTSVSVCTDCLPPGRVFPREQDPEMFGPWTGARFEGYCAACGTEILPGDDIRSDGQDGWLGRCCGEDSVPALPLPHVPDPKDVLRGRLSAGSIDRGRGTGPG